MMRKRTSAIPSDRIQLSNQRANTDRCRDGYGGGWFGRGGSGSRGEFAPLPANGAPKSCMRLILASRAARRNSHAPSSEPGPLPNSYSEFRHRVGVTYTGRETCHVTLPFNSGPGYHRVWHGLEGLAVQRRTPGCEDDDHRLVRHPRTVAVACGATSPFDCGLDRFGAAASIAQRPGSEIAETLPHSLEPEIEIGRRPRERQTQVPRAPRSEVGA